MQISDLVGKTVTIAVHHTGQSDCDEMVMLTFSDGTTLDVGTSEWLHININGEEPDAN